MSKKHHIRSLNPTHTLSSKDSLSEAPQISNAIPLGKHWVAVVLENDSVLIMHQSEAPYMGSDKVFHLNDDALFKHREAGTLDEERLAVRTFLLATDGSLLCDLDGISPSGHLTNNAFCLLEPTISSSKKYFLRNTGRGDW